MMVFFKMFWISDGLKMDIKSVVSKQNCVDFIENDH